MPENPTERDPHVLEAERLMEEWKYGFARKLIAEQMGESWVPTRLNTWLCRSEIHEVAPHMHEVVPKIFRVLAIDQSKGHVLTGKEFGGSGLMISFAHSMKKLGLLDCIVLADPRDPDCEAKAKTYGIGFWQDRT